MYIEELRHRLIDKNYILKGCSASEIREIENFYSVTLPKTYVNFLEAMGKSAGNFMIGSSMFYNDIFDLRKWAIELLEENTFTDFLRQLETQIP